MSSRIRRPETTTLDISCGDTLTVRRHLTAGETRHMFEHMQRVGPDGEASIDPMRVGLEKAVGYLVDWTITDADDQPIPIRGQTRDFIIDALDSLDPEDYAEIVKAVDAHDDAMGAERRAQKNGRGGGKELSVTSPSPDVATGDTNGSATLT